MFDKEFFPTPVHVIQMMVGSFDLRKKNVLEPSAGKGDIIDFVTQFGANVYSCEKNPELAKIVSEKSRFWARDFFDLRSDDISHIDLILMNPPFSNADKHILHAWEIAPEGSEIISLCNWATLDNKYTASRSRLASIIHNNGVAVNIGDQFSEAERSTDCEIGMVHLYKPKTGKDEFEGFFDLSSEEESTLNGQGVVRYDAIQDTVSRYVRAVQLFDETIAASNAINELTKPLVNNQIKFGAFDTSGRNSVSIDRDTFKKSLQKASWLHVFSLLKMDKHVTQSLKNDLNVFIENQSNVPFTVKNVYKMVFAIVGTHSTRMDNALVQAFDKITAHYYDNRFHVEGWKTNDNYIVNKKIILPNVCGHKQYGTGNIDIAYNNAQAGLIDDLAKALCHLVGTNYQTSGIPIRYMVEGEKEPIEAYYSDDKLVSYYKERFASIIAKTGKSTVDGYKDEADYIDYHISVDFSNGKKKVYPEFGTWIDWMFFKIKFFKKGTVHMEFKSHDVWEQFNRRVSKLKGNVLPENIKL